MKKLYILSFLIIGFFSCQKNETTGNDLASYVDPFIGTADHGHVYPGATLPFGMVQLSPDNGTNGWDWCGGYNYIDSVVVGFSHTHLSGTGIGDLCDILLMPTSGEVDLTRRVESREDYDWASAYSHEEEKAEPGFYSVKLLDNDILVELTAGQRIGMHRYTFPKEAAASVVVDLGYAINWDKPMECILEVVNDTLLTGYRYSTGWAKEQRVFFAIQFSRPFTTHQLNRQFFNTVESLSSQIRGKFFFEGSGEQEVMVKVGLSSADVEGALAALQEIPHWDFDRVRAEARQAWNASLAKITVEGDDTLKTIFYTAFYHSQLAPVLYSDAKGRYKGVDGQVKEAKGYTRYDIFSLWDTFRANHPLFTLTQPDKVNDMIRSFLAHYEEYGLLPVWSLLGNETNTMTGYHAVPIIADAYLKGYRDYDAELAFEAMKKSAMQDIRATDVYREYGYIPYDKAGESVTRTLEYCYDDWCIAQMAKALGKEEDYAYFMKRSDGYKNLFDPSTGFMRAKLSDGTWKTPFDPKFSSHDFSTAEYTEGNAWQHSWFVPQDPEGLIALHGGNEPFVQKLDQLFTEDSEVTGENKSADISGLIGQYAHGNEPSHHIVYLYSIAGAPKKTQKQVREIMATQYTDQPNGLCGNEDCGQMSAWYVFSAMGFYPLNPANGRYVIGSPLFTQAVLHLPEGKTFTVSAPNNSRQNIYIQSLSLNGQPLDRHYLTHEEIMAGGELVLEMSQLAN